MYIYVGSMSVSSSIKSRNIMFMFYWAIGQTMENLLSGNQAVNFKTYCFTIPAQGHRSTQSPWNYSILDFCELVN